MQEESESFGSRQGVLSKELPAKSMKTLTGLGMQGARSRCIKEEICR